MRQSVDFDADQGDSPASAKDAMLRKQGDRTDEVTSAEACLAWARHAAASNGFADACADSPVLLQTGEQGAFATGVKA